MDINAFNAARTYGAAQSLLKSPSPAPRSDGAKPGEGFDPGKIAGDMAAALTKSEQASTDFMLGKADPHSVVEALAAAELAVETAVTLRNKVVEAYQELMRMPV